MAKKRTVFYILCLLLFLSCIFPACSDQAPEREAAVMTVITDPGAPLLPDEAKPAPVEKPAPKADPSIPYNEDWMLWFREITDAMRKEFPDNAYWNHIGKSADYLGVTNRACNHHDTGPIYCNRYTCASTNACGWGYGTQCAGFAGLLSDRVFGSDAPVHIFYDYDAIRPGDQARINKDTHTVFILEKTDDYVVVAECNAGGMNDCKIAWGRQIPRNQLGGFYLTRMD